MKYLSNSNMFHKSKTLNHILTMKPQTKMLVLHKIKKGEQDFYLFIYFG